MNAAQTLGFARQMEVEMSKEGAITPALIGALTGAGVGGLAGYAGTDDPRKKWRNALLGGLGGGAAGGLVGHAVGEEPVIPGGPGSVVSGVKARMEEQLPKTPAEIVARQQQVSQWAARELARRAAAIESARQGLQQAQAAMPALPTP